MVIVDGHNLTFADDRASDLLEAGDPERSRNRVLEIVTRYAVSTGQRAHVVFDGTGGGYTPQAPRERVRFTFAGEYRSADQAIVRMVRDTTGRRDLTVVSNDREVLAAAKRMGANTLRVDDLLEHVARVQSQKRKRDKAPEPRAKQTGATPAEVEYWLGEFPEGTVEEIEKEIDAEDDERKK